MEPLSKFLLNQQIVTMRHAVRRSRVHVINKLFREAKKLKGKKGNDKQVVKNNKKAERFIAELLAIKKLDEDAVTKYALQNEVPTATILNSVDITSETRARARLAGHKLMVDAVQSFRNKYPDWKSSITELLKDLGSKHRAKKQTNQKKDSKVKRERKTIVVKKDDEKIEQSQFKFEESQLESSEEHSESENTENETNLNESDTNVDETQAEKTQIKKILRIENNVSFKNDNNELKTIDNSKKVISKKRCNENKKSQQITVMDTQVPELVKKLQPENNSSNKLVDNTKVEFEKNLMKRKTGQNISSKVVVKKKKIMVDDIKPICETVDSFFMTADDRDYMSVYKPPPPVDKILTEHPKLDYQKPKEIFIKGKKVAVIKTRINNMGNRRERRQQQAEEPVDTVLHPSWEAKRKQKSLAKFEGKKITFDDKD